ncbi:polyprenyl diphosphate synthase [Pseudonocardia sp. MH-G8]|uniref:polyprenyl diphosphate synthase n=1 Tax=Pseudonocardia sp. MH-G8 TaxID=1854588 RepID=UPI000BA0C4F1|nr:polyprenyl diphosphate synthase [Pseudonocardia sp. MH-G8]OZM83578.1 di-trans,poly-cis-decaprenylcistransferase [Pseudonocardia sp. MH-G8]
MPTGSFHPLLRQLYERRLHGVVTSGARLPRHVGLVMDGNRRWARQMGMGNPSVGHRYGAEHVDEVLGWCRELGIDHVTVYVASLDNLRKRDAAEVAYLLGVIEDVVAERLAAPGATWQVHLAGRLDALPDSTAHALKLAEEQTRHCDSGAHVTIAVGYDGRVEIVDALRALLDAEAGTGASLADVAARISDEAIAAHLYTAPRPPPDLIIRTSGERRLSGFLLWQSANAELFFCDTYWPAFRRVDFLRALRDYARRDRRFGR